MNFNNYPMYPGYVQPYQDRLAQLQTQYQQTIPTSQASPGLLWVQGESGAKSYLVAPNTTILLMDSESQRFYIKSTDGAGMPSLRTFEYKELTGEKATEPESNMDKRFVTREEYEALKEQHDNMINRLNAFLNPVSNERTVNKKKEVQNDE